MTSEELPAQFEDLVGADAVHTGLAVRDFGVDGITPRCIVFPASLEELRGCVVAADAAGLVTIPVGNGSHLGLGRVPDGYDIALSTRRLRRILAHEAADMTVTVEAGLTVAEVNATLATAGQWLPMDPPCPEGATVGGLIACDATGPLRLSQGKVRDLLIGIKVVLADGAVIKGGGRVVKNVAGYDLMKLFTGSFGTLGIIVEATFRVRPRPQHEATFLIPATTTAGAVNCALEVLRAPLMPLYIEALNRPAAAELGLGRDRACVVIGCGGSPEEIEAQRQRVEALAPSGPVHVLQDVQSAALHAGLRDFALPRHGSVCGCKLSLLPSQLSALLSWCEAEAARCGLDVVVLAHVGSGVALLRCAGNSDRFAPFAASLREAARQAGGYVVFDALPTALKQHLDPWGLDVPGLELMRGIKGTLDPRRRLSPGRFVGGI